MRLAVAWTIRGEDDAIVHAIDGADVVAGRWLIRDAGDHGCVGLPEAGNFIDLPVVFLYLVLLRRRAHDHAEDRFGAAPVHARLADRDCGGALQTGSAVTR